ncbi:MAG TPA: hypothetical protein PLM56_13145 [Cyclobacteriaceae bacterium]|nr:hypothetical protein [Cytophagales bacterium]HRE66886.1 hypothetical protein [Cyclobacteriaceae bacterium]HRF34444.1 hypothetical protein [Cyclobacteriaceae bacterium]
MKRLILVLVCLPAVAVMGQDVKKDTTRNDGGLQLINNTEPPIEVIIPVINPKSILVEEVKSQMSRGLKAGFQINIPEVTPDQVEKDLQNDIRNKTKSKVVKTNNEFALQGTVLSAISDKPLNVYVLLTKLDSSTQAIYFFEQDSVFIADSVDRNKANLSKEYVRTFAVNQYKLQTQKRIKAETDKLETLEKELRKQMSQNEEMHLDIKKLESEISNANMDIKANQGAQDIKTKEIYKQKEQVAQIKEKETKKTAEKVLSDMNKENKKLRDELESLNRKIVKHRAEIESIKVKIRNNLEDQYLKKQAISKQRGYVRGIEAMAQSIR